MSFVSDMKVNGKEVTPFLNSLKRDSCTFYNGEMQKNVTIGESSDGQFIYMTGLLPLRSVVTISQARRNKLPPSLTQQLGYSSRMLIPTVETMWRQDEMCQQYGFDSLYTSKDYNHGYNSILTDEQIFQLAIQKDRASQQPFFSVILTMSMHQPYSEQIDPTFPISTKAMREDLAAYLNKCHYTDKQIELYFDHLHKSGLFDNSLIILAADHPVLSTDFGGVSDAIPFYLVYSQGLPSGLWHGPCHQVDIYATLVDLLCDKSSWYGMGRSLLRTSHMPKITESDWNLSEQIIMGDYFQPSKRY
jgi:lipoteichoic acid synthase